LSPEGDVTDDLHFVRSVSDGLDQIPHNNHDSILDENDDSFFNDASVPNEL